MKKEIVTTGKTVEAAVEAGAKELGVSASEVTYEVIEAPKKGFLGIGETPATVKVIYNVSPEKTAIEFIHTILRDMDLEADTEITPVEGAKREFTVSITGPDASALIGHHGETLDSLQYLVNLVANRRGDDDEGGNYTRLSLDIENYRAKREETLTRLAKRTAAKAVKYRRNMSLEPMNSYERRIIHSALQSFEGVTTGSVGVDSNRRVVIYVDNPAPRSRGGRPDSRRNRHVPEGESKQLAQHNYDPEDDIDGSTEENLSYYAAYSAEPKNNKIQKRARFDDSLPEYHAGDAMKEDYEEE